MGMPNTGRQLGPMSGKGVTAVTVNGIDLIPPDPAASPTAERRWRHAWGLAGETLLIFTAGGADKVPWTPLQVDPMPPYVWLRAYFDLPVTARDATAALPSYALNLTTMTKGVAYVNGFNIGRYWLIPGVCSGECAPPIKSGHCYMHWRACDQPTQTLYHVPTEVLQRTRNMVVLFDEAATAPMDDVAAPRAFNNTPLVRDPRDVSLVALYAHPA